MKKIWGYVAALFAGISIGLVAMYKLMGDQIEINIRRIKTKRGSSDIDIPISVEKSRKRAKKRKSKRLNKSN